MQEVEEVCDRVVLIHQGNDCCGRFAFEAFASRPEDWSPPFMNWKPES